MFATKKNKLKKREFKLIKFRLNNIYSRSRLPCLLKPESATTGLLGSRARIWLRAWKIFSCDCCVLCVVCCVVISLCDEMIICLENSYWLRVSNCVIYEGVPISPLPDQEGNKLQRPNSEFIQYTPHKAQYNFLACHSDFCKPLKKKNSESCPPNHVSAAGMTYASDEKWLTFNCFFSVQGTGGSPMGPNPEIRVGDQDTGSPDRPVCSGLQVPGELGCCARTRPPW